MPKTTTRTVRAFRLENALWDAILVKYEESDYETLTDFVATVLANAIGQDLPPPPPPPPVAPQVAVLKAQVASLHDLLGRVRAALERVLLAYKINPIQYRSVEDAARNIPKPALWAWCGWWEVRGFDLPRARKNKPKRKR
jgi:hypothetical protein